MMEEKKFFSLRSMIYKETACSTPWIGLGHGRVLSGDLLAEAGKRVGFFTDLWKSGEGLVIRLILSILAESGDLEEAQQGINSGSGE